MNNIQINKSLINSFKNERKVPARTITWIATRTQHSWFITNLYYNHYVSFFFLTFFGAGELVLQPKLRKAGILNIPKLERRLNVQRTVGRKYV